MCVPDPGPAPPSLLTDGTPTPLRELRGRDPAAAEERHASIRLRGSLSDTCSAATTLRPRPLLLPPRRPGREDSERPTGVGPPPPTTLLLPTVFAARMDLDAFCSCSCSDLDLTFGGLTLSLGLPAPEAAAAPLAWDAAATERVRAAGRATRIPTPPPLVPPLPQPVLLPLCTPSTALLSLRVPPPLSNWGCKGAGFGSEFPGRDPDALWEG